MADKVITCKDCGNEFVFTEGEQAFYLEKGFTNDPVRCPECRKKRRQKNRKKLYDAVCTKCGAQTQVPFKPKPDREILCKACFDAQRG